MNKTKLFPGHFKTHLLILVVLGALVCATGIRPAYADAAPPPDPTVGNAGPYRPQKTMVQMMSETVLIDVPPTVQIDQPPDENEEAVQTFSVNASFTMQNQGQAEEKMQVIFPLSTLTSISNGEQADYRVDWSTFVVWVDGKQVPVTVISTPAEKGYQLQLDSNYNRLGGFRPDVDWAAFDVTFPVHQNVSLRVAYRMDSFPMVDFEGIDYILETGAGWYGRILSADLILHLPYAATEELVDYANPGYVISGNELRWKLNNLEPTSQDNLSVGIIRPGVWQNILDLRSRVEKNPGDAEAWFELGGEYRQLAIWDNWEMTYYSIVSRHFADLSIESYEKAIALRPDWGEAHYGLAYILWHTNPLVEKRFAWSYARSKSDIPLSDPAIQRVVRELKLAWAYGVREKPEGYEGISTIYELNLAIPDLKLTPPATYTVTPKPATQTPASTPTAFVTPTGASQPSATPTPASTQPSSSTALGGVIVGMLIVLGVLVYSWRSKFEDRR